jgi:hypothetical protein
LKIKKGDQIYLRRDYKTTYENASGPYIATEDARLEMVQDISEEDAKAEGCEPEMVDKHTPSYGDAFQTLWNSINKKPGTTWADNPEVVRIAFEREKP